MEGVMEPTNAPGGADRPEPPPIEDVQAAFPQLEIIEVIGVGGMGVVYKAKQISLNRLVALKLLAPHVEDEPGFAERFSREAQALATLSHPNIVTVHDFGEAGGFYYLLMEYVDGITLRQALTTERFSPEQALAIVPPICEALEFAHDHNIVHRDIKPENLLLDKDGRIKVADFGIARILGQAEPEGGIATEEDPGLTGGATLGTPKYMAPEQADHPDQVDHRADIYSLGVVLYEMLTGESPTGIFQPPTSRVQVDVRLDEIVLRALDRQPELRFQTAAEFRTMVETVVQSPTREEEETVDGKAPPHLWAPFQSPMTARICANMTPDEKRTATMYGLLFGVWNAATFFLPLFVTMYVPAPLKWPFAITIFVTGILFYPFFRKIQYKFLIDTAWARARDIKLEQLKLTPGDRSKKAVLIGALLVVAAILMTISLVMHSKASALVNSTIVGLSEQRLNGDLFEFKYHIALPMDGWDPWINTTRVSGTGVNAMNTATSSQILSSHKWVKASVRLDNIANDQEAQDSGFSSIGPDRRERIRPLHGVVIFHCQTSDGDRIMSTLEMRPRAHHTTEPSQQLLVRETRAEIAKGQIGFALNEILSTGGFHLVLETTGAEPTWKSQPSLVGDGFVPIETFGNLDGETKRFRLNSSVGALRFTFPGVHPKAMEIAQGLTGGTSLVVTQNQPVVLFDMTNVATEQQHRAVLRLVPDGVTTIPDLIFPLEPTSVTYYADVKFVSIVGWLFLAAGVLYVILALPLIRGTVPMNRFYGFRIPAAFESGDRWRAINNYGGKQLAMGGVWVIAVGIVGIFVPYHRIESYTWWACAATVLAALVPAYSTWRWAQRAAGAKPSGAERAVSSVVLALFIALFLKTFVIATYSIKGDSTAPELPKGSIVVAFRLMDSLRPGDVIIFRHESGGHRTGRVLHSDLHKITIQRNETAPFSIERTSFNGKVVTVLWRARS